MTKFCRYIALLLFNCPNNKLVGFYFHSQFLNRRNIFSGTKGWKLVISTDSVPDVNIRCLLRRRVFNTSATPTWRAAEVMRRPGNNLTNILFCYQPTTREKTCHWLCGCWRSTLARGKCVVIHSQLARTGPEYNQLSNCRSPNDELSVTSV